MTTHPEDAMTRQRALEAWKALTGYQQELFAKDSWVLGYAAALASAKQEPATLLHRVAQSPWIGCRYQHRPPPAPSPARKAGRMSEDTAMNALEKLKEACGHAALDQWIPLPRHVHDDIIIALSSASAQT